MQASSDSDDARDRAGRAVEQRIFGDKAGAIDALMAELDPEVGRWARQFVFGDVWTGEGLEFEDRLLVAIVSLTVLGKIDQLRNYLFGALNAGVAPEKVQQALAMTCVYAGFPAALTALGCWREVQASHGRDRSGIAKGRDAAR